jgi:hypothetical protein
MSMPNLCSGHDGAISCTGCAGAFVLWENHWHASQEDTSFVASSIIAGQ